MKRRRQYAELCAYLALGVVNLINLFQPDVLCIGGGVSNEEDEALLHPLQRIVQQERFGHDPHRTAKVVKAGWAMTLG